MNGTRLINVLIPTLLLGFVSLCINLALFGFSLVTYCALPFGLCFVVVHLLINRYRSRRTAHSTFTRLPPEATQALLAHARDLELYVTAIRARSIGNAEMVWTGWSTAHNAPTWTILFDETLYATLSQEETTALLYHEMGHGLNGDTFYGLPWIAMAATWVFTFAPLGYAATLYGASEPFLFVGLYLLQALVFGGTTALITHRDVVKREYAADEWAVRLSGNPQPMLGVLEHMAARESIPSRLEKLQDRCFPSHPPARQRIANLKRLTPPSTH